MDDKIDITSCCRLCLSTKLTFNIHTSKKYINSDLPPLNEIIKELTTIQIEKEKCSTNISNNICFSCNYLIIKLYSFRQQSIISNNKFQEAVKDWKTNQASGKNNDVVSESESKDLLFADSLVSIYARCLVRAENKCSSNKNSNNTIKMCQLSSKKNLITPYTPCSNSLSDSALSIALNEHIFNRRSSNEQIHSCHPSVNRIIEENPNIILSDEAVNYNYDCRVVIETFKQLFREALCPRSKMLELSKEYITQEPVEQSFNQITDLNDVAASIVSFNSHSDVSSEQLSETKAKINNEQCPMCKRNFSNMLLLEEHMDYCHKMKNEAIVLTKQLNIPKRYKYNNLSFIKLINNEEQIRLHYKSIMKTLPVPKLVKNKKAASKSNSSITFKTLDIVEGNELLQKLISDTISPNISDNKIPKPPLQPLDRSVSKITNFKSNFFSSIKKVVSTSTTTPTVHNPPNELVSSINESATACYVNKPGINHSQKTPIVPSLNKKTEKSTVNMPKETHSANKSDVVSVINKPALIRTTNNKAFDYETHRKKMLKSSLQIHKDDNGNAENSNISSSASLCQEYLPLNRPITNNDIACPNVPVIVNQGSAPVIPVQTPVVSKAIIPDEIIKPNFYVDNNMVNVTNDNNLKRKNDEITSNVNSKRCKTTKSNSKRIFRDLQGCTNILEKLFAPQLDLEEILRKDLSESDLNEIDTLLINSAVSAYLRKNPRYFNLLEQLIGIRDLPVVVNMGSNAKNTFDFIKAKCPDKSSDIPLVEMSRINWNNTHVLQNFTSTNKFTRVSGKSWQKKKISIPLSNWKQCATESLATADQTNTPAVDFEQLIDTNCPAFSISYSTSVTNNIEQLSNVNSLSSSNSGSNTTCAPTTQKKSLNKIVIKRYLQFSGDNEKPPKQVKRQKSINILPKTKEGVLIKERVPSQISHATKNVEVPVFRDNGEIIEIEDDNDMNIQTSSDISNKDALMDSELGSLKIVSVMSLNDDYNSCIEKANKTNDNTNTEMNVNEYLNSDYIDHEAPIEITNVVGSFGILNTECDSTNLNTNSTGTQDTVNVDFQEVASCSGGLDHCSDSTNNEIDPSTNIENKNVDSFKQSGISVLSPTRINLLFKKKELKV